MERLLDYFVPERYMLNITIDKEAKTIGGMVKILGQVKAETVKFHAVGLTVEKVLADGKKVDFETRNGLLMLKKVPRSVSTIEVEYHGSLNENMEGAYLSTYEYEGKIEKIVATQFESHYAREAFPCIDEPAAKAVFELAITVPEGSGDIILANTPVKNVVKNTTMFEPTPRMSTYLLAWVIGRFHGKTVVNEHGVEIATYCALNQDVNSVDFANEIAARSLEFYDDNFGVSYPLKKLDQVALPDFEAGAMENWGLVTYRESMLLVGEAATLGTKKGVALTVAHELSHQWFGDLVTMRWWDDLWLNESFASVMEYFAVDKIHPEYKIFEGFFTGDCYLALLRDEYKDVQSVHQEVHDPAEIATLFDSAIVYSKGARLMLMVVRLMGWADFCKGLKEYFEKYKYSNTVGDDLWECLNKHARFNVGEMMHGFIDRPGYPVITNEGEDFEKFSQKRFLVDGEMSESDWLLPEVWEDMTGHYILNLTDEEFRERLEGFDKLGMEEKVRLLIDRNLLTKTDLAPSASLVPLVQRFKMDCLGVWMLCSIVAFCFKEVLFKVLFAPAQSDFVLYRAMCRLSELLRVSSLCPGEFSAQFINIELASQFMTHLSVALWAGLLLAFPYLVYELYAFVAPGLYEQEKHYSALFIGFGTILFVLGVLLNYFIIFPFSFRFLSTYQVEASVVNQISLSSYINTFLLLSLLMGLLFEIPILSFLLAKIGLIDADMLKTYRKHAFVLICIVAAVITPTGDVFTLMLVTLPIYLLYELSIIIVKLSCQEKKKYTE